MNWELLLVIFACIFVGTMLGGFLRDQAWVGKAESGTRMLCGKQFYIVSHANWDKAELEICPHCGGITKP